MPDKDSTHMKTAREIEVLLRARSTLIVLVTQEETRALDIVKSVCEKRARPCYGWDIADGFTALTAKNTPIQSGGKPLPALDQIRSGPEKAVYVLKDFHAAWSDKQVLRRLRSVAQELTFTHKSIIVTTPSSEVPGELKDRAVIMHLGLPDEAELDQALAELLKNPDIKVDLTKEQRADLIRAALGLTYAQAQRVFAKGIVTDGSLNESNVDIIINEKKDIIRDSNALEFYPVHETPANVGGLGVLKEWFKLRKNAFGTEAKEYGLPTPKGIALIGIPGTGKSLSAKMIGNLWGMPLVRFDVGSLFGSYVGESEERTRKALRLAEAVSPCILWIDEMEKALAHGGNDSGTSTRVFGTILTWMAEKRSPCFVVATANDIASLPPELLRRGRFDEIFFLDLPTREEREEILSVHIRRRGRQPKKFDLKALSEASLGYTGAELEHSIIDAMYVAFSEKREFATPDVLKALKRLVPLSISQRERVAYLRSWLMEGRAQSASFPEAKDAKRSFVKPAEKS